MLPYRSALSKRTAKEKIAELLKILDVIDKLDVQYGFYLIKKCFDMSKLLKFLLTCPCFLQNDFLEKQNRMLRNCLLS